MQKLTAYFREVYHEARKVTWPQRNELIESTTVVIVFAFIVGMFVYGVDLGLGFLVDLLLGTGA